MKKKQKESNSPKLSQEPLNSYTGRYTYMHVCTQDSWRFPAIRRLPVLLPAKNSSRVHQAVIMKLFISQQVARLIDL